MISRMHNEIMTWLEDFTTKNNRPLSLAEAKKLIADLASNYGSEISDEDIENWCYETEEANPDLIQC